MYVERTLTRFIRLARKQYPVLLLTGARQTGKTTLLRHLADRENRSWVTLDDLGLRRLAVDDPTLFLQRFPPPLLIDEFQYAPGLLWEIKKIVDASATRPAAGRDLFWLSGSQTFLGMRGIQESLAGRVAVLELQGFSLLEKMRSGKRTPPKPFFDPANARRRAVLTSSCGPLGLFREILRGDKPFLHTHPGADAGLFYSSYLQTTLERDLQEVIGLRNLGAFENLVRLAAARTAQILNLADLARDAGVAPNTARSWISLLERSGQIFLLPPYYKNFSKRLIKRPKLYFFDTGLAAYLTGWTEPKTAMAGPMAGALFETFVLGELYKSYAGRGVRPGFYFWHTRDAGEVDLVLEREGRLTAGEVKLGVSISGDPFKALRPIEREGVPIQAKFLFCLADAALPFRKDEFLIPASGIF
jgi:hypothetical protein